MFCEECANIIINEILEIQKNKLLVLADIFTRSHCFCKEEWISTKLEINGEEEKIRNLLKYFEKQKNKNTKTLIFHDVYYKENLAKILDFELYQHYDQYNRNEFMRIHKKNGAYRCFMLEQALEKLKIENKKLKLELSANSTSKKDKVYIIATSRADPFEIEKMKGKGKKWKVEKYEREARERKLKKLEKEREMLENVDNPRY